MTSAPETRYARSDKAHIAYQVVGDGPQDVVLLPIMRLPIEDLWTEPNIAHVVREIGSRVRFILFDRRGTGQSDPVSLDDPPALEHWIADATAVMDTVASKRAWLFGIGMGSAAAALMAASQPERVQGLVVAWPTPRTRWAEDYPWGQKDIETATAADAERWGTASGLAWAADEGGTEGTFEWLARAERHSASPGRVLEQLGVYWQVDVRNILPLINVPTLVVAYQGVGGNDPRHGRYFAEHVPGAKLIESESTAMFVWSPDRARILDEIIEFVTGSRPKPIGDRVLATIMFTDVVSSTEKVASLGDSSWRELLDRHDQAVDDALERFGGHRWKHTGDGILATFDGPARAIRCMRSIAEQVRALGLEIRAGVHTGEVERRGDDISGIAVHIGQRVSSLAKGGEVLVSRTVTDLVAGSGLEFEDRGERELKGVPGRWHLYAVKA